jgi:hypothetical protein
MPVSDGGPRRGTVTLDMSKLLRRLRRHRRASERVAAVAGPPAITLAAALC